MCIRDRYIPLKNSFLLLSYFSFIPVKNFLSHLRIHKNKPPLTSTDEAASSWLSAVLMEAASTAESSIPAVSYTHLDVYKRQS